MTRQLPIVYRLKAIRQVEQGEGALHVARDLGITPKLLHDWIKGRGPKAMLLRGLTEPSGETLSIQLGLRLKV